MQKSKSVRLVRDASSTKNLLALRRPISLLHQITARAIQKYKELYALQNAMTEQRQCKSDVIRCDSAPD